MHAHWLRCISQNQKFIELSCVTSKKTVRVHSVQHTRTVDGIAVPVRALEVPIHIVYFTICVPDCVMLAATSQAGAHHLFETRTLMHLIARIF